MSALAEPEAVVCAWCGRLRLPSGEWVELPASPTVVCSHGICPSCGARFEAEAEQYLAESRLSSG